MKAALYIKKKLEGGILTRAFHSDPVGRLFCNILHCLRFEREERAL